MKTHRDIATACLAVFLLIACPAALGQDEPELPEGLAEPDDDPAMNGGDTSVGGGSESETEMTVAKATACRLLGREDENEE